MIWSGLAEASGTRRVGASTMLPTRRRPGYRRGYARAQPRNASQRRQSMKVAIALFPRNTSLDAIGPYETLQRVPSIDVVFVGHRRGEVRSDNGMLGLMCDAAFDEVTEVNREAALASQLMIEYDPGAAFRLGPPRQ